MCLILVLQYARLLFKEMRERKQMCVVSPLHIHGFAVRREVRLMIEADLLAIIYLFYYSLIASTIINVALIIVTTILVIKQQ